LAWLSILVIPVALFYGHRQYLNIPEMIRGVETPTATQAMAQQNIYMFFLDGSQITSGYLSEDHFPKREYLPVFRKFLMEDAQWFPNALANAPVTHLSFPSMITGKLYVSLMNNYRRHERNIFSILAQRYRVHAFLHTKTSFCMERPGSCHPYNVSVYSMPLKILFEMYGFISTFRLYPISFKIGELNSEDYDREIYTKGFLDKVASNSDKGNFYIIQTFDRKESQLKDFDSFFGDFLSLLKRKGYYEDALIIIMSDHGFVPGPKPNYGPFVEQTRKVYSVPFAIKTKGTGQGRLYGYQAQGIDIAPTLLARVLPDEELGPLEFDGVDLLRDRPQREHYINFDRKDIMYKLADMDGDKPGLVEVPLSRVRVSPLH